MSARGMAGFGAARGKREPVEVAEPRKPDNTLDRLAGVRAQRLERYERERIAALHDWRATRSAMRAHKLAWRALRAAAQQQWQQSRRDFFAMAITSAAFRAAKGAYARMTLEAETEKLNWRGALHKAQAARTAHASARAVLRVARREQEKLACLADELKSALRMSE